MIVIATYKKAARRLLNTATPHGMVHMIPEGDVFNLTLCGRKVRAGQVRWDNTAHASLEVRQRAACDTCSASAGTYRRAGYAG